MLDEIGAITLDQARQKARGWLSLIAQGIDPKAEEARQRAAARRQQVKPSPQSRPSSSSVTPPA